MSSIQVRLAEVAPRNCTCINATPKSVSVMAHSPKCVYRLMLEAIDKLDEQQAILFDSGGSKSLRALREQYGLHY